MKLRRWDYEHQEYIEARISDDWNVKTYSNDMAEIVNCPSCGKELEFGEGYSSQEFHNFAGFGYCVCSDCYEEELDRVRKYRRPEKRV